MHALSGERGLSALIPACLSPPQLCCAEVLADLHAFDPVTMAWTNLTQHMDTAVWTVQRMQVRSGGD
jgi:hypothetical protein